MWCDTCLISRDHQIHGRINHHFANAPSDIRAVVWGRGGIFTLHGICQIYVHGCCDAISALHDFAPSRDLDVLTRSRYSA